MGEILAMNPDGTCIELNKFGLLIGQNTLHRGIYHMITFEDLYFASRMGRAYANHRIIDEINRVNSQFFEEV